MPERQLSMFDTESIARADRDTLAPIRRQGQPLSKAQQGFNKRVAKVEQLRVRMDRETLRLDKALAYFWEHLHPRTERLTGLQKDLVRALAPFLDDKRLKGKADRRALREMIGHQLESILVAEDTLTEDDLRALFERVHHISFERAQQESMKSARDAMEDILEDAGIDVDLSDFGPEMNEESAAAKLREISEQIHQKVREDERQSSSSRRKTPKEMEREQRLLMAEELRRKTIGAIYKQLARVLHPDLEQDPARREKKTSIMQELTAAYRNNDLHTLLRLELQWIEQEKGDLNRLTDEKLAIYNEVLKEQAEELRQEIEALPYHPRYHPLLVMDGPFDDPRFRTDGPAEAFELDRVISSIENTLAHLRTDRAFEHVRGAIREYRKEVEDDLS